MSELIQVTLSSLSLRYFHPDYISTISSNLLSLQSNNFSIGSPTQHTVCISIPPLPSISQTIVTS